MVFKKTTAQEQQTIHSGEAFEAWQHLVMRYDILELTDIFQSLANDPEFKVILTYGIRILNGEIEQIEGQLIKLGIPLPPRPPKSVNPTVDSEILRDQLMFRTVIMGIQNFLNEHLRTILMMQNTTLRNMFVKMMESETQMYAKLFAYGKLKGWLHVPPEYKLSE